MMSPELQEALREADAHPEDARAQIEAAYACERAGEQALAIRYYESAWQLGVPPAERANVAVGYGEALRSAGRVDDAVAVLGEAAVENPDYAPANVFLGLALVSAGQPGAGVATLLDVILRLGGPDALDGYEGALARYHGELLEGELSRSEPGT